MKTTVRRKQAMVPTSHYWNLVKDMDNGQKLELVAMLIDSVRLYPISSDVEQERERGFRSLAGCWADDRDDDDMEAIIRQGRKTRPVTSSSLL